MTLHSDRRLDAAKEDLVARLEELQRRIQDAKTKLDIPAKIAEHPILAVGAAFALGALLGGGGGGRSHAAADGTVERGLGGTVMALLGALAVRLAKEIATHYATDMAKSWLDDREPAGGYEH